MHVSHELRCDLLLCMQMKYTVNQEISIVKTFLSYFHTMYVSHELRCDLLLCMHFKFRKFIYEIIYNVYILLKYFTISGVILQDLTQQSLITKDL